MKKALSLILALVMCLSLCACKSSEVKNVEAQIGTLSTNSTYEEIHSVYSLYSSLSLKDQDKVENLDMLGEYCDPLGGEFVLSEEMLQEIEAEFEVGSLGVTGAEFSVMYDLGVQSSIKGWNKHGNIKITSHKKTDAYTYSVYGTFQLTDEYGSTSTKKFTMSYFAEYSAEEATGYVISHDTSVQ